MNQSDFVIEAIDHSGELMGGHNDIAVTLPDDPVLCNLVTGEHVVDLRVPCATLLGCGGLIDCLID